MTPTVVAGDPAVLTSGDTCLTLCDSGSGIVAGPMPRRGAVAPVVRARALHGVPALVTRHGGDATAYFARFGLPLVPAEDMTVPVADMNLLLDTAAAELGCAAFGLLLAEAEDETILGPLAVALSACATVAEAADCASRFLHVHCPAMTTTLRPGPTEPGTVGLGSVGSGRTVVVMAGQCTWRNRDAQSAASATVAQALRATASGPRIVSSSASARSPSP